MMSHLYTIPQNGLLQQSPTRKGGRSDQIIIGMCCSLSDKMGMRDGRQETQPEFTPRLTMTAVQGQTVAKGNSRSMLTSDAQPDGRKSRRRKGEAKEKKQGRQGQGGQS